MSLRQLQTFGRRVVSFRRQNRRYSVLVDSTNCVWEYEVDGQGRVMRMPTDGEELRSLALRFGQLGVNKAIKDEWARADQDVPEGGGSYALYVRTFRNPGTG